MVGLIIYTIGAIAGLGAILYIANKVTDTKEVKEILDRI